MDECELYAGSYDTGRRHCETRAWDKSPAKKSDDDQVAVIASIAKQSRKPDNVWFNNFVIIRRRCIEPAAVTEPVEVSLSLSKCH